MKTAEILQAIGGDFNKQHAQKLCKIFAFLKQIKKQVIKAELQDKECFHVETANGFYNFWVPAGNDFFHAVCELLDIGKSFGKVYEININSNYHSENRQRIALPGRNKIFKTKKVA